MRASGVLLPVSSLPSRYGIGCFSKEAYHFVDTLKVAGQRYWQILPLGPTSYGDSPYQALSTFAGNPYFIDPEELVCEGLLTKEELSGFDFGDDPMYVDYEKLYHAREGILRLAYKRFILDAQYRDFVEKNARWLDDFALYMAIKNSHGGDSWLLWEEPLKLRDPDTLARKRVTLSDEMNFIRFQQFTFFIQWMKLKKYANDAGIKIIGDIPIYVSLDSADTWANWS